GGCGIDQSGIRPEGSGQQAEGTAGGIKKRGACRKKRTFTERERRQWQACSGNDKSVAVIARDEKQHLTDEARQRLPLAPARKGMRRDHERNYLHASFVVCQNWHALKDL
ncbi:hypothetical protein KUCAC02_018629, partial [Chaenocephalus aceratus]